MNYLGYFSNLLEITYYLNNKLLLEPSPTHSTTAQQLACATQGHARSQKNFRAAHQTMVFLFKDVL